MRPRVILAVALGGAVGTTLRWALEEAFAPPTPPSIPWVTLAINLGGAFALGMLMAFVLEVWPPTRYVRPSLGIGVLGGFTTFSTLSVEAARLVDAGQLAVSMGYMVVSSVAGLVVCAVGWSVALRASGRVRGRRR